MNFRDFNIGFIAPPIRPRSLTGIEVIMFFASGTINSYTPSFYPFAGQGDRIKVDK